MTKTEQKRLVEEQFAIDYNCSVEDFLNKETLVTRKKEHKEARKFEEESMLSILSYQGKLVINASDDIYSWCEEVLKNHISAAWGFEIGSLISIDKKLAEFGCRIDQAHIFFLPKEEKKRPNVRFQVLVKEDILKLEDDERIDEAFLFDDEIEDMLGIKILSEDEKMLAVAGASNNSERMWEMGVNSFEEGKGYGAMALMELIKEVQNAGRVPFAGTAMSHFASQNIMLKAGMVPSFCELRAVRCEDRI